MKWLLNALFGFYHVVISPLLGRNCRYAPSCSVYTRQAIDIHGVVKGSYLGLRRLARCHPWGGHGYDPVPGSTEALSAESLHANDGETENKLKDKH